MKKRLLRSFYWDGLDYRTKDKVWAVVENYRYGPRWWHFWVYQGKGKVRCKGGYFNPEDAKQALMEFHRENPERFYQGWTD
jgi:hypothetical protein